MRFGVAAALVWLAAQNAPAPACSQFDWGVCEGGYYSCIRECSDLTHCGQRCCDRRAACLSERGCSSANASCGR